MSEFSVAFDSDVDQTRALTFDTGAARTQDADTLVIGLPNYLVTLGLVRLNSGAGLVGVLTEILGILGGITTDSTAR